MKTYKELMKAHESEVLADDDQRMLWLASMLLELKDIGYGLRWTHGRPNILIAGPNLPTLQGYDVLEDNIGYLTLLSSDERLSDDVVAVTEMSMPRYAAGTNKWFDYVVRNLSQDARWIWRNETAEWVLNGENA